MNVRKKAVTRKATVKKKTATRKKKVVSTIKKEVIGHDPFAVIDEAAEFHESANNQEAVVMSEQDEPVKEVETESAVTVTDVELGHNLTIADAESRKIELSHIITDCLPIRLNAEDVEQVDGAGLQLLAVFFKDAQKHGIDVSWGKVSPVLLQAVNMLGLSEVLKMQADGMDDGEGTAWGLF
jgi:anti-anti-sigma regulatory factor